MKVIGGVGNIGSMPFKGSVVSLDGADMADLIGATTGLVKALVGVGAGALALIFVATILEKERVRKATQIPIGYMARVKTHSRDFLGIPITETLEFICAGQEFNVKLDLINSIFVNGECHDADQHYVYHGVELIDKSRYTYTHIVSKSIKFVSVAGIQTTTFPVHKKVTHLKEGMFFKPSRRLKEGEKLSFFDRIAYEECGIVSGEHAGIEGVSWSDIGALRERLKYVIDHNAQAVISELGEDIFNKYFVV